MQKFTAIILVLVPTFLFSQENSPSSTGINWDIMLKAVGTLIGAIIAYSQIKSTRPISLRFAKSRPGDIKFT
jgi:hypothetical protein